MLCSQNSICTHINRRFTCCRHVSYTCVESEQMYVCRHVSVTMKNYRPEMVLGESPRSPLTEGGLAIRVGSFSGKPITPKAGFRPAFSSYLIVLHLSRHSLLCLLSPK